MGHDSLSARRRVALLLALLTLLLPISVAAQGAPTITPSRPTRLFFGSTGRALGAGEGYVVLHSGIVPSFQVGLTDRVSIGAGTMWFAEGNFWLTPKVQIARGRSNHLAAGAIHLVVPGEGQLGVAYLANTRDTARGGLTFGAGVAYSDGWDEDDDWAVGGPLVLVGGDYQLSRRVAFVSENYLVLADAVLLLNGVRVSWQSFSLDVAALVVASEEGAVGGPFLNLAWRF